MYYFLGLLALAAGYGLDMVIGDPRFLWHPIRAIGWLITITEKFLRKLFPKTDKGEFIAGIFLVIIVTILSTVFPLALIFIAYKISIWLGFILETIMCYQILATKALKDESMKVYEALNKEGLDAGRKAVSMIVGRDTENLSKEGVIKATVETIAENTADGIIAPMLYLAIAGPACGFFYKSVNTMDSMVGYKNDKYMYFGRVAAKLDDVLNFFPARIAGWLMIFSSRLLGLNYKNAKKIFLRDRFNHASPNSAQTESVMAGALGVELAGDAVYFGKVVKKKTIGDKLRPIVLSDIKRANALLYMSSAVSLLVFMSIKCLIGGFVFHIIPF
ncbi:adenosylcobinamide-phosphate synthase CbiB [Acetitomaculum ruminis]